MTDVHRGESVHHACIVHAILNIWSVFIAYVFCCIATFIAHICDTYLNVWLNFKPNVHKVIYWCIFPKFYILLNKVFNIYKTVLYFCPRYCSCKYVLRSKHWTFQGWYKERYWDSFYLTIYYYIYHDKLQRASRYHNIYNKLYSWGL